MQSRFWAMVGRCETLWGAALSVAMAASIGWLSWSVRVPLATPHAVASPADAAPAARLLFTRNVGQAAPQVRYLAQGRRRSVAIFDDGLSFVAPGAAAHLRFEGATERAPFTEREAATSRAHVLQGADPSRWLHGVAQARQLRQSGLYRGIDIVYYSRGAEFEFDFVVQPGADPAQVRLRLAGEKPAVVEPDGSLALDGPGGMLRLKAPLAYQQVDGQRLALAARWRVDGDGRIGFDLPAWDRTGVLVIDPVLNLLESTYLGGVHDDQVGGMTLDAAGNAYVIGNSGSEDWPVSGTAYQPTRQALGTYVRNVVVSKFDAAGNLLYSTFIGGSTNDYGNAIAVDASGNAYLTGRTESADFPVTADAAQPAFRGAPSAYLAVLSPDGSTLRYASFYGGTGSSQAAAIALDAGGAPVIAGHAGPGLPTTAGAYKPTLATGTAAFVARFSPLAAGAPRLVAASYYGVDNPEPNASLQGVAVLSMALAADGSPWFTGQAYTTNLPLTANALQRGPASVSSSCAAGPGPLNGFAYVARLSADLRSLAYASYLTGATEPAGGTSCSEFGRALAVDASGDVFIAGGTGSAAFPTTAGALQRTLPTGGGFGAYSGFVTRLKGDGSAIVWSTYFGGNSGSTFPGAPLAVDRSGSLWFVVSTGGGSNYPISADALQRAFAGGASDAGLVALDAATGALRYSSYMGGSGSDAALALASDGAGTVYVAGATTSTDLPATANAFQPLLTPNAFDGSDWFFRILGAGAVARVLPASGGNAGDVTLRVDGAGFVDGAVCALAGQGATIAATSSAVAQSGTLLGCSFALAGVPPGPRDLVVTNPDGTSFTRVNAFTVKAGQGPDVSVEVVGRSAIRVGVPSVFGVVVGNDGDADAYGVALFVRFSKGLAPTDPSQPDPFGLALGAMQPVAANDPTPYSTLPIVRQYDASTGVQAVPLFIPFLAAGAHLEINFKLVGAAETDEEFVEAEVLDPMGSTSAQVAASIDRLQRSRALALATNAAFGSGPTQRLQALSRECLDAIGNWAANKLASAIPIVDCAAKFGDTWHQLIPTANAASHHINAPSTIYSMQQLGVAGIQSIAACAKVAYAEVSAALEIIDTLLSLMQDADELAKISDKCRDKDKNKNKGKKSAKKKTQPKKANDPNDKSGPDGDGSALHHVVAPELLAYRIGFENQASASLPAAEVVVTDQLDAATMDLATVTLGSISWGPYRVDVPPGRNAYTTVVPLDATMSVRVSGSLDAATGILRWTFTTLDPGTRLPPSDPTLGFLPPNRDGTQGQGYVNVTVAPRAGLPDGTRWQNAASIVFDANAPIATPTWVNTLDATPPVSRVTAATAHAGNSDVDVSWSGSDAGSGISRYSVYVSDNGGPWTLWQNSVATTTAVFAGTAGHTYGFRAQALDAAGNVEPDKSVAEASATAAAGGSAAGGGGGGCTIGAPGQRDATFVLLMLAAATQLWRRRRHRVSRRAAPSSPGTARG